MSVAVSNVTNPCTMSVVPMENPFLHSNFIERYVADIQGYQESLFVRVNPSEARTKRRVAHEIREEIRRAEMINHHAPVKTYTLADLNL